MTKEVLIILGGGVEDETLNPVSKRRVQKAAELARDYRYILCSSDRTYLEKARFQQRSEAAIMKDVLMNHGVPEEKILLEERSKDTFSNAVYSRRDGIDPYGFTHIDVLTSQFHMEKTQYLFAFTFPETSYTLTFISVPDRGLDPEALRLRKRREELIIKFYEQHLQSTYGLEPGNLKHLEWFMHHHNRATSGNIDEHHEALSRKVAELIPGKQPPLY